MPSRTEMMSVLFVDIADSTKLLRKHGDAGGRDIIVTTLDLMASVIEERAGRVVDRIGDELMCSLPSAATALDAAISLQEQITQRTMMRLAEVSVRVGFHHGPVLLDGDRIFGDTVHTARRMASAAKAQQVVTTADTLHALGDGPPLDTRVIGRLRLAGHERPVEAHEIIWNPNESTQLVTLSEVQAPAGTLILMHRGDEYEVGAARAEVVIGRGTDCDLVINGALLSRRHARVEVRDGGFALIDMSTNGTRVCLKDAPVVFVKRGEAPVSGVGEIRFGPPKSAQDTEFVRYYVRAATLLNIRI